ncbi:MAG: hypothetical protein DI598_21010, partial [Pseudopedobacter saltans]
GITADNNACLYRDVVDFYGLAGEGAELNIMLVSDATSLETICDTIGTIARKALDFTAGRAVILLINALRPASYVPTITTGLDADVWAAASKLNILAKAYQDDNLPFVGVLPGLGFAKANIAALPDRKTLAFDNVGISLACEKNDGHVSMGVLGAWLFKAQVCQNIGRVAFGKVVDTAFYPDATSVLDMRNQIDAIAGKGLIQFCKVAQKSGYYFYDDPTATAKSSDYSSLSWNRTMNKGQRISADTLSNKINEDVDVDATTGKIESALISDWESDVENDVRAQMGKATSTKIKEISGVACTIDPDSDIVNDQISASIEVVRNGQAKQFNVSIGYTTAITE